MKTVHIDRAKRLKDQPTTGHNRFHPDVPPIVVVEEGEEVVLETRDGVDGQLGPATTETDMAIMQPGAIHPLTGPVFVKGTLWKGRSSNGPPPAMPALFTSPASRRSRSMSAT